MFDVAATGRSGLAWSVCATRTGFALLLVVAAPLLHQVETEQQASLAWLIALVWLPTTGLLYFLALHGRSREATVMGAVLDPLLLFVTQLAVPEAGAAIMMVGLLAVGLYGSLGGRGAGLTVAAAIGLLSTVAGAVTPGQGDAAFALAAYAGAAMVLTVLVDSAGRVHRQARLELASLRERSDAILARVADGVLVTDSTGRVRQWNKAAERLFDCPTASAIGRHCHEVLGLHVDARPLDCTRGCALLATPASTDPAKGVEVWRGGGAGQRQPLLANVSAVTDREGRLMEIVHSLRDVTRLKEAEEAKTLFLATASHELKTPLTVIQGYAQTMLANPRFGGEERERALEAVVRRAVELSKIVDRLLLSSRIEAGKVELSASPVPVAPILADRARALSEATGRHVRLDLPESLPPAVADPVALATVVDHLLDNAVKYSPVEAEVVLAAKAGADQVEVWVRDRGIGMTEEQAARCFEKFWQAESSDSRRFGGTGIGLYIVRSLVEAMGATIAVRSAPGQGTTFVVTLARRLQQEPDRSVIREVMRQVGVASRGVR